MTRRIGISIDDRDLEHIRKLQKRFGIRNRSKFFRELIRRYKALEDDSSAIRQCIEGYRRHPESTTEGDLIVQANLKDRPPEDW